MVRLWHRNTRRYGGYIVHFGVALVFIGILGTPFNREAEKEMAFGDKMALGPYTLLCRSYTQEENANYSSDLAIIQIFKGDKQIDTLYPESRFYTASQQQQHVPAIRSTLAEDIYVVYEGQNQDTGRPIIKAHLNPMVSWIWIGLIVMVFGTILSLVPNAASHARNGARQPLKPGFTRTRRRWEPATDAVFLYSRISNPPLASDCWRCWRECCC